MAPKKKSPAAASKRPSAEVPEPPPDAQVPRQTSPTLLLQPPSDSQAESAEATPAPLAVPNAASALTGPVADPPPSETHGAGGTSAGDVEAAMDTSDSVRDHERTPCENWKVGGGAAVFPIGLSANGGGRSHPVAESVPHAFGWPAGI